VTPIYKIGQKMTPDEWMTTYNPGAKSSETAPSSGGTIDYIYEKITQSASAMRDKYANNKYFEVIGFQVNVGIAPSVSINFNFRKQHIPAIVAFDIESTPNHGRICLS
jgi:hypothetical protein